MNDEVRTCTQCEETKPLEAEFYKAPRSKDGYFGHCKVCHRGYQTKRKAQSKSSEFWAGGIGSGMFGGMY